MKDLLDKLSSYNIFNYLLPGVLFAAFVDGLTSLQLIQKDLVVGVFVYYFLGSTVSRIGSLMIEPILKRVGFVTFAPYDEFVRASKADPKLDVLSEANNMYRTLIALMVAVAAVWSYDQAATAAPSLRTAAPIVCIVLVGGIYLISYRKQTAYIVKRVAANKP